MKFIMENTSLPLKPLCIHWLDTDKRFCQTQHCKRWERMFSQLVLTSYIYLLSLNPSTFSKTACTVPLAQLPVQAVDKTLWTLFKNRSQKHNNNRDVDKWNQSHEIQTKHTVVVFNKEAIENDLPEGNIIYLLYQNQDPPDENVNQTLIRNIIRNLRLFFLIKVGV